MKFQKETNPTKDTGWGLIFRLNDLWNDVERLSPAGKYDDWDFKLDRIYSNLLYRERLMVVEDENNNIISIELSEKDIRIKKFIDKKIRLARKKMRSARKSEEVYDKKMFFEGKNELYENILLKEIWLRKFMHELGLYIKEIKHNPAGAMWGR